MKSINVLIFPYSAFKFFEEEGTMIIQEKDKLENIAVTV